MSEPNVTPEAMNPQPPIWPECGACRTPYILRRVLTLSNGGEFTWLWVRDCKNARCKKAKPVVGGNVKETTDA